MTEQHPITPPPELVDEWFNDNTRFNNAFSRYSIATQAARWGADQELEACCEVLRQKGVPAWSMLRSNRRPKPPSLKELALAKLAAMERLWEASGNEPSDLVRTALEQLDD